MRAAPSSIVTHIERLRLATEPEQRARRRGELRRALASADREEADRLRRRLVALGDDDPGLWRACGLTAARRSLNGDESWRFALLLLDGAWYRLRRRGPDQPDALLREVADLLRDGAAPPDQVSEAEVALRRAAGYASDGAADLWALARSNLPPLTTQLLGERLGLLEALPDGEEVDDGLDAFRAAEWRAELDEQASELTEALRAWTARARGPDWPEQSWDSYRYDMFELTEWCVTVPFAALVYARRAVVPVAAAERILALPDDDAPPLEPWERPSPGRAYRRYWTTSKRFLALVAEIAARYPDDGGASLASALLGRLRHLPPLERPAVELHCASLGLLDHDPGSLARQVLEAAAGDDLGARGELVLHTLQRIDDLPAEDREELLYQATQVARRTTAFVASNPFAACLEALGRAEGGTLEELVELIHRAATLKIQDWQGWQQALHAGGRWVALLASRGGVPAVEEAVEALSLYREWFPGIDAMLYLAGSRGLDQAAGVKLTRRALDLARRLRPSAEGYRAEVGASLRLAELGAEGAVAELRWTAARILATSYGRAQQVGLQVTAAALAALDSGEGDLLAEALELAGGLRHSQPRWLAYLQLATSPAAGPETIDECLDQARRTVRRWLRRRPPMDVLVPFTMALCDRPGGGPRDAAARRLIELAAAADDGSLSGRRYAAAFMAVGEALACPEVLTALAALCEGLGDTWWQLPLLALIADGAAGWLEAVAERQARSPSGSSGA